MIKLTAIPAPTSEFNGVIPTPYPVYVNHYHIIGFNRSVSGEPRTVVYCSDDRVFDVQESPEQILSMLGGKRRR